MCSKQDHTFISLIQPSMDSDLRGKWVARGQECLSSIRNGGTRYKMRLDWKLSSYLNGHVNKFGLHSVSNGKAQKSGFIGFVLFYVGVGFAFAFQFTKSRVY